jgi:hypothetical protein
MGKSKSPSPSPSKSKTTDFDIYIDGDKIPSGQAMPDRQAKAYIKKAVLVALGYPASSETKKVSVSFKKYD